jgi:hypothetical protein
MKQENLQSAPNAGTNSITKETHLKTKRLSDPLRVLQKSINLNLTNETPGAA